MLIVLVIISVQMTHVVVGEDARDVGGGIHVSLSVLVIKHL